MVNNSASESAPVFVPAAAPRMVRATQAAPVAPAKPVLNPHAPAQPVKPAAAVKPSSAQRPVNAGKGDSPDNFFRDL